MRAVWLTHNYPRQPGDVAGAFLHPLAVALRARGVDVRVIAPSDRGRGGDDMMDGVPIRRVRYARADDERYAYTGAMADAVKTPQGLRALAGLIRAMRAAAREEADGVREVVVHAHWWIPSGLAAPRELPMVLTCHGTDVRLLERSRPARWLGRTALRRARVVTTVSAPFAATLRARGGVRLGDDAIQPMPVVPIARPRSTGGGGAVVLGRLTTQKRVGLAIEAWLTARARGYTGGLTIVGDGPARAEVTALAHARAPGQVVFVGAVPPSQVPRWLQTADVLLMTAEGEGLGLVATEALMQGVPVVACTDGGGVLDVVPAGGAGRVVAPSAEAIAEAMLALAADTGAADAAYTLGQTWAARLDPDAVAERAMGWYRRALGG
ncbi:MAG TPA: glycosyltransferase [Gemmatimonadales bacterium]|nr:glycosyltransferase [Gemmatimonadales bacterium]